MQQQQQPQNKQRSQDKTRTIKVMHQSKYQAPPSFDHILGEEAYYFSINLNIISLFEATRLSTVTMTQAPRLKIHGALPLKICTRSSRSSMT